MNVYHPHIEIAKGNFKVVLSAQDIKQYRRYILDAPSAEAKPYRSSFYYGPKLQTTKYVWELELILPHLDWRCVALNYLYSLSCNAQQSNADPYCTMLDYIDPVVEPPGVHEAAPIMDGQPSWTPPQGITMDFLPKFAQFYVLLDQPIRTRRGSATTIELKITER